MSKRTIILLGVTVLGVAATVVSAIKDHAVCECIEDECCDCGNGECCCELADPTEI